MALRVTQGQMYTSSVFNMNQNLSALMESNLQSSSQLKINRPSDDPLGAGRVISYRASIDNLGIYRDNISAAMGWLGTADSVLSSEGSFMTVLTRMKELAEQAATETYDKMNREEISYELRQSFLQLITLANTRWEGRSIFGGQKTEGSAYDMALGVTCNNTAVKEYVNANTNQGVTLTASGDTSKTAIIQFTDEPNHAGGVDDMLSAASTFRYSMDGGKTWHEDGTVNVNGEDVTLNLGNKQELKIKNGLGMPTTSVDPNNVNEKDNGTWLYTRPSAVYNGDDNGTKVVTTYSANGTSTVTGTADGTFSRDIAVRIDALNGSEITYSYSMDDGNNWVQAVSSDPSGRLPIPGGSVTLGGGTLAVGDQFMVHPYRADINMAISDTDSITVNLVGKEIFGGLFKEPFGDDAVPVEGKNVFEICGKLVGATEYGSPDDVSKALDELKDALTMITSKAAVVGGRYNRLQVTDAALSMRQLDEADNLSRIEDVDVTELMTRLSMQQIAYNSVLKSSSMVMQMSLVNFL